MKRRLALQSVVAAVVGGIVGTSSRRVEAAGGVGRRSVAAPPASGATFVDARDGTRLRVRDWGSGRAIVFVAPWALCVDWWDSLMTTLASQRWRCVAFDRRGHGRSDEP